jgi:hypothetical protein
MSMSDTYVRWIVFANGVNQNVATKIYIVSASPTFTPAASGAVLPVRDTFGVTNPNPYGGLQPNAGASLDWNAPMYVQLSMVQGTAPYATQVVQVYTFTCPQVSPGPGTFNPNPVFTCYGWKAPYCAPLGGGASLNGGLTGSSIPFQMFPGQQ